MAPDQREVLPGDRVTLVARRLPGDRLARLSLGLDLPSELELKAGEELAVAVRVRLIGGRPHLDQADVRVGDLSWSTLRRPESSPVR